MVFFMINVRSIEAPSGREANIPTILRGQSGVPRVCAGFNGSSKAPTPTIRQEFFCEERGIPRDAFIGGRQIASPTSKRDVETSSPTIRQGFFCKQRGIPWGCAGKGRTLFYFLFEVFCGNSLIPGFYHRHSARQNRVSAVEKLRKRYNISFPCFPLFFKKA